MKLTKNTFFIDSPAKLNLSLNIHKKHHEGYHYISSYIVFLNLKDNLEIINSKENSSSFYGEFSSFINSNKNLVLDALNLCKNKNFTTKYYNVKLNKNIPVSAGLGGGSTNAAAIFRFFLKNKRFNLKKNIGFISELGSDIPACIYSKPLFSQGFGEKIQLVKCSYNNNEPGFLLVKPNFPIKTKRAFSLINSKIFTNSKSHYIHPDLGTTSGCLKAISMGNNFNEIVNKKYKFTKNIQKQISELKGCIISSLTGSGPTCFGLFNTVAEAKESHLYALQKSLFKDCWLWSGGLYK